MTLFALLAATTAAVVGAGAAASSSTPSSANCTTSWFTQSIDHYSWGPIEGAGGNLTWQQRYLINADFWRNDTSGAVFFYTGNEGGVTLYANHSGLMWENAAELGALVIFAEHRYYGESWPFGDEATSLANIRYLSSSQALADYAVLLRGVLGALGALYQPVIAFGGSYGGVLSAFFRAGYPGSVAGAIAASAPLRSFPGQAAPWDSRLYMQVITRTASAGGGCADSCAANVRASFPLIFGDGGSAEGRARLSAAFSTCAPLETEADVQALAFFIRGTFDEMSMGSYPYPSSYLTGGTVMLPAFPVRVACGFLADVDPSNSSALYAGLASALGVLNNATPVDCNAIPPSPYVDPSADVDGIWDYQECTEMQPDSDWFGSDGVEDMFYDLPRNLTYLGEHCLAAWGVVPSLDWITTKYALPDLTGASNIVFSNGLLDPWSGASIQTSPNAHADLVVFNITDGAHHLDLFFSDPADPPSVTFVRSQEVAYIRKWILEFYGRAGSAAAAAAKHDL